MRRYNPKEIEPKWQKIWEESKIYQATEDKSKPKRYVLEYFPYPSGAAMHVGHVRNYTIGDVVARHGRMSGLNILHPMGWDAFGLPAENYAIKTGISPQAAVAKNVENFKQQLMRMGFSYDWTREINSTDPAYYKWTQWFFLFLFEKGLAYQKESLQWWCPFDKTVLANEQVENGRCWRCGHEVEKKSLKQWFFKITDYADRLDKDLENLDWSPAIKAMQHNWIGKSIGAEIKFPIPNSQFPIPVFTTRPDTIFGATFLVLAPEHEILNPSTKLGAGKLSISDEHKDAVLNYIRTASRKSEIERQETDREKTGVFTGLYALNPANKEKIPIWVADYVLPGYGTGAIMAVPAHDQRDFEFAKRFSLPIRQVIASYMEYSDHTAPRVNVETITRKSVDAIITDGKGNYLLQVENEHVHFVGGGADDIDDNEQEIDAVCREVLEETGYKNISSVRQVAPYVSGKAYRHTKNKNQKVWGAFYEVVLKDLDQVKSEIDEGKHKVEWVPKERIAESITWPWHLDAWNHYLAGKAENFYDGEGVLINSDYYSWQETAEAREKIVEDLAKEGVAKEQVSYKLRDWLISRQRYWGAPIPIIHCQKCGSVSVPEADLPVVLPEVKSYEPSGDGRSPLANVPEFVNVKCPKCGGPAERETDTMDGFACSSWYFLRFADPRNDKEPFSKEKAEFWLPVDDYIGGAEHAVMHLLYARFWTKVMFDDGLINFDEPFLSLRNQGMILAPDGQKMSKSKGNTIEPDELISQGYGADSIRLMELFIGPWNQAVSWSVDGIGGTFRFLQRYWTLSEEFIDAENSSNKNDLEITAAVHKTIKKVTEDLARMEFNTAIAAMMSLVNELYKIKAEEPVSQSDGWRFALETLTQLLAPFAPHITEEVWESLGHDSSVHVSGWPAWDEKLVAEEVITLAVQINGKVRSEIVVPADISEADAIAAAKGDEKAAAYLRGQEIKKAIYVPGRLVSLVI